MKPPPLSFSFWIRIYGHGISIHNGKKLFSERMGLRRVIRIFGVAFEFLKKDPTC